MILGQTLGCSSVKGNTQVGVSKFRGVTKTDGRNPSVWPMLSIQPLPVCYSSIHSQKVSVKFEQCPPATRTNSLRFVLFSLF